MSLFDSIPTPSAGRSYDVTDTIAGVECRLSLQPTGKVLGKLEGASSVYGVISEAVHPDDWPKVKTALDGLSLDYAQAVAEVLAEKMFDRPTRAS